MKLLVIYTLLLSIFFFGCGTQAASQIEEAQIIEEPAAEFDLGSISQEVFESTKIEVQNYIEEVNSLIRAGNFEAWKDNLSDEYFKGISDPEFLRRSSESALLKRQGIVLQSPQDYFTYVVVPSRANSTVDDIEFISQNRVKAFTINNRNERLRLYDLEHTGNTWKIIN